MSSDNFFSKYDWETMLSRYPVGAKSAGKPTEGAADGLDGPSLISEYHSILCPPSDYPDFLDKYIALPLMQRLGGIGLLCGTDWTRLYNNRFYYSRLDHSKGVALIIWHFTHDKAQTLAGLFHDVSTPVFSHVSDFRKGDALTQTATEAPTAALLRADKELGRLLAADGLTLADVEDYHKYPIADNEIPQLSADRLEYMFPSGMALDGSWTLDQVRQCYEDLTVVRGEEGTPELAFRTLETAELYCEHFCMIGHILQLNENKLALQLLGQVMNLAVQEGILHEDDFMTLSEREVIEKLEAALQCTSLSGTPMSLSGSTRQSAETDSHIKYGNDNKVRLFRLYKTFRQMSEIEHTETALPENEYFCVNLKVKQRYINPLVVVSTGSTTAPAPQPPRLPLNQPRPPNGFRKFRQNPAA